MARLCDSNAFQQEQIEILKKESFDQLSRRPSREKLITPVDLQGLEIFICRRPGENGGVEITVRVEKRALEIFLAISEDGFEIFPDGRLVRFDTAHGDDED